MKNLKPLFAAALLLSGASTLAMDTPHDGTASSKVTECLSCHQLHSGGGTLTKYSSNNDACLTCHDGTSSPNNLFAPAWSPPAREATPGTGGDQHKWSGSPTTRGARIPLNADMSKYLAAGDTLQCAVCHDPHGKKDAFGVPIQETLAPNSVHASYKLNVAMAPTAGGVNGRMKLISLSDGGFMAWPASYAIRIKAGNTFEISHDYKSAVTPTWANSIPYTVGDTSANDTWLDDPSVLVRFTVAPAVGDIWEFYVSYPFLRASNVSDAMCVDCHADRVQNHDCIEGVGTGCAADGVKVYSHPVGEGLRTGLDHAYDRAAPLDADGTVGSSTTDGAGGVANPGNDLVLDGGIVRCTTCHAPHNADSNSLSVDVR